MNQHIFRAYDIRGTYPDQLNAETAKQIAKGYISFVREHYQLDAPRIIVGKDNRPHGPELQEAFIAGLKEHGARVDRVEDCPSPMLYHAVCTGNYDGGVNITASHNPSEYNGFKLLGRQAHSIAGDDIQQIKHTILNENFAPLAEGAEQSVSIHDDYFTKISSITSLKKPLKVVVDAGNAIAGKYYPELLRQIGCEVIELYCEQDGNFPNHQPDPIVEANTEDLKAKVLETGADLGIAFDGDGDRLGIIDNQGQFHTADESFYLLIQDILPRHPGATIVYTVSNSFIIPELVQKLGGEAKMVPVGHSFVEIAMTEYGAPLGGEQSGHFFIAEQYYGYDDAGYCAAKLCEIFSHSTLDVTQQYSSIPKTFSKPELRLPCPDEQKFAVVQAIAEELSKNYTVNTMDGVRIDFEDGAWLGIRASNTSPKLSVLMEARSEEKIQEIETMATELLDKTLKD